MEKKFCAAPWRGLHINFRGDVKTCCAGDPNLLENLNNNSINEVLQSEKMIEIKESIRSGILHPEYCSNCIKAERYGRSERHWHNDVNQDFDIHTADNREHRPSIIDVRWNITCNLACNYCGPYCSSKWASMMKFEYKSGARPYYDQVCDYISQNKQHVREVALVGGEPLLLPENERLLEMIPDDAIVTLITNMNVDFDRNPIVQKLATRAKVGWSMSFDNIADRFEYVRYHGSWNLTEKNVRRVNDFIKNKGHWGGIHAVYNVYNCTKLQELRGWADQERIKIHWQTLYQPEFLDPALHNFAVRDLALAEISSYRKNFILADDENNFFRQVEKRLGTVPIQSEKEKFWEHISDTETKYHTAGGRRFVDLWPDLSRVI